MVITLSPPFNPLTSAPPLRWDNRPGANPGYTRVDDVMGATSPLEILNVLDIDAAALGYAPA